MSIFFLKCAIGLTSMFQSGTICSQQPSFELNFVSLIRPSVHQWNNSTMFVRKRPKISHKSSYKTVTSLSNVNSQVCNYSVLISHFPSQLNTPLTCCFGCRYINFIEVLIWDLPHCQKLPPTCRGILNFDQAVH